MFLCTQSFQEIILEKQKNILPKQNSQLNHIFAKRKGHLENTSSNQNELLQLINDMKNFCGTDSFNCQWFIKQSETGGQYWAKVFNHTLSDGGYNSVARLWNPITGLCQRSIPKK